MYASTFTIAEDDLVYLNAHPLPHICHLCREDPKEGAEKWDGISSGCIWWPGHYLVSVSEGGGSLPYQDQPPAHLAKPELLTLTSILRDLKRQERDLKEQENLDKF